MSRVLASSGGGGIDFASAERLEVSTSGGNDEVILNAGLDELIDLATIDLGDGFDEITTTATSAVLALDGGPGLDMLRFNALGATVDMQPGTISVGGIVRVTHTNVEFFEILQPAGALPAVTITSPTSAASTPWTRPFVTLAGTASDADGPVASVTWSNDRGGSGPATGTSAWTAADVPLAPGTNVITVSVVDAAGNRTFDTIAVSVTALTYSLAEGATGAFFDLDVLIANPTTTPAPVTVTFLRQDGAPIALTMTLAPTSRQTIHVDQVPGLESQGGVSTVVTSTSGVPLVVERTMFWGQGYGSHGGTAVDGPRTRWLFAEGSEGFFNTFVLLANSGASASTVTLTFLREGSTPFTKVVTVPADTRVTVAANASPELVGRSFSIVVDATAPIIAERAMYFGTARLFDGGHESTGVPEGATSWFLAEGATGPFFETFVLVGNPNPSPRTSPLRSSRGRVRPSYGTGPCRPTAA